MPSAAHPRPAKPVWADERIAAVPFNHGLAPHALPLQKLPDTRP